MQRPVSDVVLTARTSSLDVFACAARAGAWWQPWRGQPAQFRVVDTGGVVRLQRQDAVVQATTVAALETDLRVVVTRLMDFGDAGRTMPDAHLLVGSRLINLSGLADEGQMLGLAGIELRSQAPDQAVVIVATARNA